MNRGKKAEFETEEDKCGIELNDSGLDKEKWVLLCSWETLPGKRS